MQRGFLLLFYLSGSIIFIQRCKGEFMERQNSYIFIYQKSNDYPKNTTKTINGEEIKILYLPKTVGDYIVTLFKDVSIKQTDISKTEYSLSYSKNNEIINVNFVTHDDGSKTYLNIVAEGKTEENIIESLSAIHNKLYKSLLKQEYICIFSYDAISEYYGNLIFPLLNSFERLLRRFLYNIYVLEHGKTYYSETLSQENQEKIKGRIQAKGNKESKERLRTEVFYDYLEYNQIIELLFNNSEILSTDICDWLKMIGSEENNEINIKKCIEVISKHRNAVAHNRNFSSQSYIECKEKIEQIQPLFINVINELETTEFKKKYSDWYKNKTHGPSEKLTEIIRKLSEAISQINALRTLSEE